MCLPYVVDPPRERAPHVLREIFVSGFARVCARALFDITDGPAVRYGSQARILHAKLVSVFF